MGIQGSGNWCRWNTRITTASQHRVDIRWLRKQNLLQPGTSGPISWSCNGEETGRINFKIEGNNMILSYRYGSQGCEGESVEQVVHMTQTPCNYGGYRKWFLCPRCSKRVEILYGVEKHFLCRHCYSLTYDSSNASPLQRIYDKAIKLQKKLGGSGILVDPVPDRPKGQHRSTYNRIVDEILRLEATGDAGVFENMGYGFKSQPCKYSGF